MLKALRTLTVGAALVEPVLHDELPRERVGEKRWQFAGGEDADVGHAGPRRRE